MKIGAAFVALPVFRFSAFQLFRSPFAFALGTDLDPWKSQLLNIHFSNIAANCVCRDISIAFLFCSPTLPFSICHLP